MFILFYLYFIITIKSPKNFTTIQSNHCNNRKNIIVIRDPKAFCFDFDWPKTFDESLKHDIEFFI